MIGYFARQPLLGTDIAYLLQVQSSIDVKLSYADKVNAAKEEWKTRNAAVFGNIRTNLHATVHRDEMCAYCESSFADEVEHIKPKDLYPGDSFKYDNFLMSCGPCNRRKSNKSVVSTTDGAKVVSRKQGAAIEPPPVGDPRFFHPFGFNPMEFIVLDLRVTFHFSALPKPGHPDHDAALLTIEILGLNSREALVERRKKAYRKYLALARDYLRSSEQERSRQVASFTAGWHPTVWFEMKRQQKLIPELQEMFSACPGLNKL
ncbi:MAG: HNH endonuclease signature motif containing protein [Spirochaetota bacterium]